ncbi:MAG: flagellar biosynthetic protein FliR [Planctomycetota bacterium]
MQDLPSPLALAFAEHAVPWLLVFVRVAGITIFAPMFSGRTLPVRFRVLIAGMIAAAVYAGLDPAQRAAPPMSVEALPFALFSEVLIGASIGLIAGLPLVAVELAGQVIGYQIGFSLAQAANPELDINLDAIGSLLFYIALSLFITLDGLEHTFASLLGTFTGVPLGGLAYSDAPLEVYLSVLMMSTELAMRIAAPVAGVVLLTLVAIGFVMRTMPQLNVMSVSFPISILVGVSTLVLGLFGVADGMAANLDESISAISAWAADLAASEGSPAVGSGGEASDVR